MKSIHNIPRLRFLASVLCVFVISALRSFSPSAFSSLSPVVQPYVDNGTLAGAVMLAADNKNILACESVGYADIATKKSMTADAIFWIASMTKPMTAAAVMMLADEGKLSLDDPVSKYIPAFAAPQKIVPNAAEKLAVANQENSAAAPVAASSAAPVRMRQREITIRHLLSHTAGLRGRLPWETPSLDLKSLEKNAGLYAASDLLFEPGTDYSYANPGINTAGRIVEIVSGMPFETFLQKRILDPLGMKDTTFWPSGAQLARIATSYKGDPVKRTLKPSPVTALRYPLDDRVNRHAFPGGGLFSTAADVACFGQLLLNKGVFNGRRLLSENAFAEMTRRQTPPNVKTSYGLGLHLRPDSFGHGGAYGTEFLVWPDDNLVTVFMVQRASNYGTPDGDKIRPAFEKRAREIARAAPGFNPAINHNSAP